MCVCKLYTNTPQNYMISKTEETTIQNYIAYSKNLSTRNRKHDGWFFLFHACICGCSPHLVAFVLFRCFFSSCTVATRLPSTIFFLVLFHFREKLDALQRVYINFLCLLSNSLDLPLLVVWYR